jgi:transcriptional regulator of acetoin/glycerol metabolism
MPQTKETTQTATTYPTVEQYERWKARADELDMSMSEFIQSMTEAGMKEFDRDIADEEQQRVRRKKQEYYEELQGARDKIEKLEQELNRTERGDIVDYIQKNPGVGFNHIVQHIGNEVPNRVQRYLQEMEGNGVIKKEDDQYYFDDEG